ncbi:MAG: helix-turn-helix transcriptional regulator [Treponema sp.]|nr:helix-turn-helix transcriptional regulator [Treponema sp.]
MNSAELQKLFSKNLKNARNRLHFSQMKLAEKSDLSVGYICDLESGRRWGTPETFSKLADALNINPFELLLPADENIQTFAEIGRKRKMFAKLNDSLCNSVTAAITKTMADAFSDENF